MDYFRKRYPGCRIAFFYQDMVKRSMMPNIDVVKQKADIVLSFDQLDAKNYGVYYYPLVYSRIEIPKNEHIKRSDVYFVGKAKDRLDKIIAAYEVFKNAGLKCDFHIIGVEKENRKYEIAQITEYKYFVVKENEKYGVINTNGDIIIEAKYDDIKIPNPEKSVFICYEGDKTTVLNEKGEEIYTQYQNIQPLKLKNVLSV